MHNIGIITKKSDPQALEATKRLAQWLCEQGRQVTVTLDTALAANIPLAIAQRRYQDNLF